MADRDSGGDVGGGPDSVRHRRPLGRPIDASRAREIAGLWYSPPQVELVKLAQGRRDIDWDALRREVQQELTGAEVAARLYTPRDLDELAQLRDWVEHMAVERFFKD